MTASIRIAIVGSGPAGVSAACRAAEGGISHLLLEAQPHFSNTIFRYQKGKHIMAEPGVLPLRSATRFAPGPRERVLENWGEDLQRHQVNIRTGAAVKTIKKLEQGFRLELAGGEVVLAETVVLAIGVQGNINKLRSPGEDLPYVQYQLDDPAEYQGETIVVVGAGDAAIENAIALALQNTVHVVNRKAEFSRAKEGNNNAILKAIEENRVQCHYDCTIERVDELPAGHASGRRMLLKLNSKDGVLELPCDRIIGRLGSTPAREFVEACGVQFPNKDAAAVPAVSSKYESNVPGLYIIGSLAGYPLIKQCLNQGYEVVETICGREVEPADQPLLLKKFEVFTGVKDVDTVLEVLRNRSPYLEPLTSLQLREFLLDSTIHALKADDTVYQKGDRGASTFVVISGSVWIQLDPDNRARDREIKAGRIFGEMALISGRPRMASVLAGKDCVLMEIPRRAMLKLIASQETVKRRVDRVFAARAIQTYLAPEADEADLAGVVRGATLQSFKANETIYQPGDPSDALFLVRSGSVTLAARDPAREIVLGYVPAGQYFGELDVFAGSPRQQIARAAVKTDLLRVDAAAFRALLDQRPVLKDAMRERFQERMKQRLAMEAAPERGALMQFLMAEGMGEATDALLIDESLCVRCDQCEKACAATHGNVSRLDREAGATFQNLHVPTSCRHCEHPHCMKECPPDAIHRADNGEVYIEDTCIGCGNCERNCPYGVIQMGVETEQTPSLWRWMLLGQGLAPGAEDHVHAKDAPKKAVKCDMCGEREAGPACVQACPTGAAIRVGPEAFFKLLSTNGH